MNVIGCNQRVTNVPFARSRNNSIVSSMTKNKLLYHKIHDKAVNGEDFQLCIYELRNVCLECDIDAPVLILDNARIHHTKP